MSTTTTTVPNKSRTSRDILARAMATENITVIHDATAETAYFDTKRRVLGLPVWQDMTDSMYDMLIGHEVSHALHTPQGSEWADASDRVAGGEDRSGSGRHFLNVVEDARIERMIKAKFPGLRRDFVNAYRQFAEDDIFQIAGKDLNDLMLIDRLNIHFKIGHLANVPFTAAERVWIDRIENADEWTEIVDIATELWTDAALPQNDDTGNGTPEDREQGDEDGPTGQGMPGAGGAESEDEGTGNGEGGDSDAEDGEGEDGESGSASDGEDSGESADDDTDTGESAEGEETGSTPSTVQGANTTVMDAPMPETSQAMENAINAMRDEYCRGVNYQRVPDLDMSKVAIDYTEVATAMRDFMTGNDLQCEKFAECAAAVRAFENDSRKTTNMLVKQFEMKMAADQDKRTSTSKTGILDTNRMIDYRWSEDIFLRNEEIADGKSHGLVMVIDWSGSMADCLRDTVEQLLSLVFFCKKVNIPFEVYSFTNEMPFNVTRYGDWDRYDELMKERGETQTFRENDGTIEDYNCQSFVLNNLLSNRMNTREFKTACACLWMMMEANTYDGMENVGCSPRFRLSGTPLHEAMFALGNIVPEFKTRNGVQIVNTVILTDGEAGGNGWGRTDLLDPKTRKTFKVEGRRFTGTVAEWLKDTTDANVIGIYMTPNVKNFRYQIESEEAFDAFKKSFSKENFAALPSNGWTEYFVVKSNAKVSNDLMEDLPEDATFTKLKNAFAKSAKGRSTSRVLLSRFIDLIAA